MGDFKRGGFGGGNRGGNRGGFNRGGGRPSFGGGRGFDRGGRDGGRTEMFSTVCSACKKTCEVPFKPSGDKPVYCNDCFRSNKDSAPAGNFSRRDDRGSSDRFPRKDFAPKADFAPRKTEDFKNQFDAINMKLDKLIEILGKNATSVAPIKVEKKAEKVVVKAKESEKKAITKKKVTPKKK